RPTIRLPTVSSTTKPGVTVSSLKTSKKYSPPIRKTKHWFRPYFMLTYLNRSRVGNNWNLLYTLHDGRGKKAPYSGNGTIYYQPKSCIPRKQILRLFFVAPSRKYLIRTYRSNIFQRARCTPPSPTRYFIAMP